MAGNNAEAFLDAYASVEKLLRGWLDPDRSMSFGRLVDLAARVRPAVRHYRDDLKELSQLRNAIVHEPGGGHPIADPYPETVETLQDILALLLSPPRLLALAEASPPAGSTAVEICRPSEQIGVAAGRMYAGRFSQLPVYDEGRFVALLTAETVMRWVADGLQSGTGVVEEAEVREVLRFTDNPDNHRLVPSDETVFDALELFEEYIARGRTLDAILVTDGGRADGAPRAIVTIYDLPVLHAATRPRHRA